ncbi:DUF4248 domain-containing protein [Pedobacter cryophilus]|uniref:DUF4248 domain-containing protein n=1 Tax=Pedobacter cryophilus TaxID=2571271 RepID=A0A4U1BZC6_9SPHI|nr:DUF4248 domain-containing protein [Pedobacter cryophilus]TKB96856.1 DUF4248 domain-containing protein [Pedobacter cryophilus]
MSKEVKIMAYTLKELYTMYGVSRKTFKKWLLPFSNLQNSNGRTFTPHQVEQIFNQLGKPE